ncbi:MAG: hypothetical protein R3F59_34655 [Myxococcota bacterium]
MALPPAEVEPTRNVRERAKAPRIHVPLSEVRFLRGPPPAAGARGAR